MYMSPIVFILVSCIETQQPASTQKTEQAAKTEQNIALPQSENTANQIQPIEQLTHLLQRAEQTNVFVQRLDQLAMETPEKVTLHNLSMTTDRIKIEAKSETPFGMTLLYQQLSSSVDLYDMELQQVPSTDEDIVQGIFVSRFKATEESVITGDVTEQLSSLRRRQPTNLSATVQQMFNNTGMPVKEIHLSPPLEHQHGFRFVPAEIQLEAHFHEFVSLLSSIHQNNPLVFIDEVSLQKIEETDRQVTLRTTVKLLFYRFVQESRSSTVEQPFTDPRKPAHLYKSMGKRDPFRSSDMIYYETFSNRTPLQKYHLSQFSLKGILQKSDGTQAYALFENPEQQLLTAQIGDLIGKKSGKITNITATSIDVAESHKDGQGKIVSKRYNYSIHNGKTVETNPSVVDGINFHCEDMDVHGILMLLSQYTKQNFIINGRNNGVLNLDLVAVSPKTILKVLLEVFDLHLSTTRNINQVHHTKLPTIERNSRDPEVSLHVHQTDVRSVLQFIQKSSKQNFVIANDLNTSVSIFVTDVSWQEVLDVTLNVGELSQQIIENVIFISATQLPSRNDLDKALER